MYENDSLLHLNKIIFTERNVYCHGDDDKTNTDLRYNRSDGHNEAGFAERGWVEDAAL